MTLDETIRLLAVLTAHWQGTRIPDPEGMAMAYQLGLDDVPYDLALAAATRAIKTATFFPTVAELRTFVLDRVLGFPSPEEAWAEIVAGFAAGGIYREPAWSCPPVAQAVRAIGWRVLCTSPEGDPDTADRFCRTYRTYRARAEAAADIEALHAGADPAGLSSPSGWLRLVRGDPVYRDRTERGPHHSTFRQIPEAESSGRRAVASPWLDDDGEEGGR